MPLTRAQIAALLRAAGLPESEIPTGVGIALAESGGRPDVPGDGGTSFGLWQIHLPAHPDVTQACALDPSCATAKAVELWQQQGWTPWTAYKTGAYRAFTEGASIDTPEGGQAAYESGSGVGGAGTAAGPSVGLPSVGGLLAGSVLDPATWATFGAELVATAAAIALIVYGAVSVARG